MKKLLVPIDFQKTTVNALKYALQMAASYGFEVHLLHLIASEGDRALAQQKMDELIHSYSSEEQQRLYAHITVGKIESDIGKTAEAIEASFIIMGTHKTTRFEKLFGTRAIKVVSESKTPYITIQEEGKLTSISKIAMTIDLEKESVQIVEAAIDLAKLFGSEIVLVGGAHTDPSLKAKVAVNVKTTRRLLADSGIASSVQLLDRSDFFDNFLDYCQSSGVNLIAATYYPDTFTVFSSKFVQRLLENQTGIPVLTLDSQSVGKLGNYSF